ncbi:nuclear condensing complex subunit [Umbelopsis sp. AD052]|nr:nuclear condensing complex subunit [Umbelopsis sp. AD052]
MSHATKKAKALKSLKTAIPQLFQESQKPNANGRSVAVDLRKIQEACALNSPIVEHELHDIDPEGELQFNLEVIRNLNKILPVKKKEPTVDRVIRFIAAFMQYTQSLDVKETDDMQDDSEEVIETVSSRFVEFLLTHLLKGITVRDKAVRLRCCQIIALSINSLGEIDEDLYQKLKKSLFERVRDKEYSVRIQAVTALSRLQNADDEEDEVDGRTVSEKLIDIMQHDPSAEVRRVVLFNLDQTKRSIPYIIERARDIDPINRRFVFIKPMSEIPDFRMLSISQRHQLLDAGLKDRDALVLKAVSKMISNHWIKHADHNLLEFLERLDVVDNPSAHGALEAFFDARPDIIESINFNDEFWDNLSIESAFLARVFTKYLQKKELHEKLDVVLPEVTRHAFYIQKYNNAWQQASRETEGVYEYIVAQLLDIAKILDYADEIGRRKMFMLLREIIMVPDIPDDHLSSIVELIKIISLGERDFTRIMIEIISDIREQVNPEEETDINESLQTPATPSKRMRMNSESASPKPSTAGPPEEEFDPEVIQKMLIQIKCLNICRNMLERSEESLQENSSMYGLLNELIIPSVQSKEVVLREEGLHCLGLCCCLDKTLGLHNVPLFIHCIKNGHTELQLKALMILFDVIMTYGYNTVAPKAGGDQELRSLFQLSLDHENADIQAVTVQGICKIMLNRMFKDAEILKLMILLYFYPSTVDNQKLRQCLSYFLPVYCYSSNDVQPLVVSVFVPALIHLLGTHSDLEADEEMVPPGQIVQVMLDWTDPRKISVPSVLNNPDKPVDMGVQADLAIDILKAMFVEHGQTRKVLCQVLPKLYIDEAGESRFRTMTLLSGNLEHKNPINDALTRNAFNRFNKGLLVHFNESAEALDDEELAKLHNYEHVLEFIRTAQEEYVEPSSAADTPITPRTARARSTKEKARQHIEEIAEKIASEEDSDDDSEEGSEMEESEEGSDHESDEASDNDSDGEDENYKELAEPDDGPDTDHDAQEPEIAQKKSKAAERKTPSRSQDEDSPFSEDDDSSSGSD